MGIIFAINLRKNTGEEGVIESIKKESLLVVMFGIFALVMTCLAWSLLLKPGVHKKMSLN